VNILAVPPYFVFPSGYGGWKLPPYLMIFIIGYVMASSPHFEESVEKGRLVALLMGIITSLLILSIVALTGVTSASTGPSDPSGIGGSYIAVSTVWALNGWCWVAAILGFGRKHLSFNHTFLRVSNELVLPFYILHQAVIVAVAYYVVSLDAIVMEKYLLIVLVSFPIIAALLYPISKVNLLRFLFGMRIRKVPV
jgi:hypothetical protein